MGYNTNCGTSRQPISNNNLSGRGGKLAESDGHEIEGNEHINQRLQKAAAKGMVSAVIIKLPKDTSAVT